MAKQDFTKATVQQYDFNQYQHLDFETIKDDLPKEYYKNLVEKTLDITAGVAVVIRMLEHNSLDKNCEGNHLLKPCDEGALFRFASCATEMLFEAAEASLEGVREYQKKA